MQDALYKPMQSLANLVLKANKRSRGVVKSNKQLGKQTKNKGVEENKWNAVQMAVQRSI